jgi:hypothetical protein
MSILIIIPSANNNATKYQLFQSCVFLQVISSFAGKIQF